MIDTHAHLHFPDFSADRPLVLTRAFALGVTGILEVGTDPASWGPVLSLAHADPRIRAILGIHPHEAERADAAGLNELAAKLGDESVVAVGEAGLDRVRGRAPWEAQQRAFAAQIGLALDRDLPLVIHCREAFDDVLAILDREGQGRARGEFHCFSGTIENARAVIARSFLVGLGGAVTYDLPRWKPILQALPHESILLETDAPYLRPEPERRKRNEPACLFVTAQAIAQALGMEPRELESIADRNAIALFGCDAGMRPFGSRR